MMRQLVGFFFLVLFMAACSGCGGEGGDRPPRVVTKKACRLDISESRLAFGDTLTFSSDLTDPTLSILKEEVVLDGVIIDGDVRLLPTNGLALGKHRLLTHMLLSDSTDCEVGRSFTILSDVKPSTYRFKKLSTYDHRRQDFIQGLEFVGPRLYEGTGQYDESIIRSYLPGGKEAREEFSLDPDYFGEGITILNGKLYQLTYKENTGFVYDLESMDKVGEWTYQGEGWGLTNNGRELIMTDGSDKIRFIDPGTFEEVRTLYAYHDKGPQEGINELEYVNGHIYANVYGSMLIAKIEESSGRVLAYMDCRGIVEEGEKVSGMDVMNGIAYRPMTDSFFLTGKNWPKMYEVRFSEVEDS